MVDLVTTSSDARDPDSTEPFESGIPLYQQVRARLKSELTDGVWKPGEALPTELKLQRRFRVSPGTIRQAILSLVKEGLLTRRAGKGTFVARIDVSQSFERFFRFRSGDSGGDFLPQIKVLDVSVAKKAEREVLEQLNLTSRDEVLSIRRLLSQDDTPVCCHISYFPRSLVPHLEREDLTKRLYPILEEKFGLHVVRAEECLRAVEASAEAARLLKIQKGSPVILIGRTVYTYRDRVLECRKTYGRSDKFLYKIQLR